MKSARSFAVVALLCMVIGCKHKTPPPPPAAQAPILPPGDMVKYLPPPVLPAAPLPQVVLAEDDSAKQEPQKPKRPHHRTRAVETAPPPATGQKEATPAPPATGESNDSSPIGELSTAGDVGNLPNRAAILEQITSTENGLNGIKRPLNNEEQTTAAQVRTFLTKAKQLLDQNDLDGAHTLVTKARVLLDELRKP